MAGLPQSIEVEVHTVHTESHSPAAIIVKGVAPSEHTNKFLHELSQKTGAVVFALDRGVTLDVCSDEDLAAVGLQRLNKEA